MLEKWVNGEGEKLKVYVWASLVCLLQCIRAGRTPPKIKMSPNHTRAPASSALDQSSYPLHIETTAAFKVQIKYGYDHGDVQIKLMWASFIAARTRSWCHGHSGGVFILWLLGLRESLLQ